MKTLKFKTNIKCTGCLAQVTPHLSGTQGIDQWEVDLTNPDKVLTVQTDEATADEVIASVQKAGFTVEKLA